MIDTLKINEIFYSIQGESTASGLPTVFVRLTGCPLRCQYCDTAYAFHEGQRQSLDTLLTTLQHFPCKTVCITGGEPLAQPAVLPLMKTLCDVGYRVSIETSGALDISPIDPRVVIVMDIKTPASGEVSKNRWENLKHLTPPDQVKAVICDRSDFDWICDQIKRHALPTGCEWLLSPMTPGLAPTDLANWILEQALPVRFQTQLHKTLWGDTPGH